MNDSQTTPIALLPCPWCDAPGHLREGDKKFAISCANVKCPVKAHTIYKHRKEDAITDWNIRSAAHPIPADVSETQLRRAKLYIDGILNAAKVNCTTVGNELITIKKVLDAAAPPVLAPAGVWQDISTAPHKYRWILIGTFDDNGFPKFLAASRWETDFWQNWPLTKGPSHWCEIPIFQQPAAMTEKRDV